ncbi:hypothetical protein [Reichenbachiella versicolor]|uniref:hypothetical protein n=1 Tax=Reichenbachiella versicolor TaxID=1821036 RepID=UPI0013A5A0E5|nr:hypothetical protein [Reichenbachiella versicolor]
MIEKNIDIHREIKRNLKRNETSPEALLRRVFKPMLSATKGMFASSAITILILSLLTVQYSQAQVLRYPATVTPMIGVPHTLYLNDYAAPASQHLTASVIFNDFNEPVWDFRLRLTIESNNIRLTTSPNYIPQAPISVAPGSPVFLSGDDWAPYLDYRNMIVEGDYQNELYKSGRLPEGFYNFCLEVLDYNSGKVLSRKSCAQVWLQLTSPPMVVTPHNGSKVDPANIQIPFTWQMFNTAAPDALVPPEYQLTMWEVTARGADPMSAVANGQALQIYQSDFLTNTMLLYGSSEPALEEGKQYVYRVQVIDPDGKAAYKNDGYSEFNHFYYGDPLNGQITLKEPKNNGAFKLRDQPIMRWSSVDNAIPGQMISYKIQIAEIDEGRIPDENTDFIRKWYEYETGANSLIEDKAHILRQPPQKETVYAWRVLSYVEGKETGKSDPFIFNGPGLLERFYAGTHMVFVDAITEANLAGFGGEGRIRLTEDPDLWTKVSFKDLKIKNHSGFYVLEGGEFFYEPPKPKIVDLAPDVEVNEGAVFDIQKYRIDKTGVYAWGAVTWDFPHPTMDSEKAIVRTEEKWTNFNEYKLNGALELAEEKHYDLLDPYQFSIDLDPESVVYLNSDQFRFDWLGTVNMPSKVKGVTEDQWSLSFQNADQIHYIRNESPSISNNLSVLNGTRLELIPTDFTIDFSETQSPLKQQQNPDWKGAYLDSYTLMYNSNIDASSQIKFDETFTHDYSLSTETNHIAYVTSKGLQFNLDEEFAQGSQAYFNTFPATLRKIKIQIVDNLMQNDCQLEGDMYVPIVSEDEVFDFTVPIANTGFRTGYLHDLEDIYREFNPDGGDQQLNVTFKRAVFADNNRLNMTLDMHWPAIDVTLENVRGFKAWGDYHIGFNVQNGSLPLTNRVKTQLKKYPADAHTIGAGAGDGRYSMAITLDVQLGNDVGGNEGPPAVNLYSIVNSRHLPDEMTPVENKFKTPEEQAVSLEEAVAKIEEEAAATEAALKAKLIEESLRIAKEAEALKKAGASGTPSKYYSVDEMYDGPGFDPGSNSIESGAGGIYGKLSKQQQEIVNSMVARIVNKLTDPVTKRITSVTDTLESRLNKKLDSLEKKSNTFIKDKVDVIVDGIANGLAQALQNDKVDLAPSIDNIATATKNSVSGELQSSLSKSIDDNIRTPLSELITNGVGGRVNNYIVERVSASVYGVLEGDPNASGSAVTSIVTDIPDLLQDIAEEIWSELNPNNLASTVTSLGQDIVTNIDVNNISSDISSAARKELNRLVGDVAMDFIGDKAAEFANEILDLGEYPGVPIAFDGMASRFTGSPKDFAADPIVVQLNTSVLDAKGYISFQEDEPTYGDVWAGDIKMNIKVPDKNKPVQLAALYISGKKDGVNYWFAQVDSDMGEGRKPGAPISKEVRPLSKPISLGAMQLGGIVGRVYHHMKETPGDMIVPDASIKYGAYLGLVVVDGQGGQTFRMYADGEVIMHSSGDYTLDFNGNIHIRGESTIPKADPASDIIGNIEIRYNSKERHFFGYAGVEMKTEALCAGGSLLVDTKPGQWRVALGTSEDRIYMTPGCVGWGGDAWLDINEYSAEFGLGLRFSMFAESPTVNLGFVKFYVYVDAGIAAGILAQVRYKPKFGLMKAGVWVEVWVDVGVGYQKRKWNGKWKGLKTMTLVEIFIRGELLVIFDPSPTTLTGNVKGTVKVLGFKKGFNASVDMTL